MSNMSYCRFENTLRALQECDAALREGKLFDPLAELSDSERLAAKALLLLCEEMAEDYGETAEDEEES